MIDLTTVKELRALRLPGMARELGKRQIFLRIS